jgi:thioesterase domain-containing protein
MEHEDLQAYIYDHIPIVRQNGFAIETDDTPYATVSGHFKEHINHRNSVFGGSLSTALILASWASVRGILRREGITDGIIVIQSQSVRFEKPVMEDFVARVVPISNAGIAKFLSMYRKFGKTRIRLEAHIAHAGSPSGSRENLATFEGDFVVMRCAHC